jgi:hypothetical protein
MGTLPPGASVNSSPQLSPRLPGRCLPCVLFCSMDVDCRLTPPQIPKDLREEVDWLESWKFVPGRQMVPRKATVAPPPPPAPAASSAGSQDSQVALGCLEHLLIRLAVLCRVPVPARDFCVVL